jgi:hypothetical protein
MEIQIRKMSSVKRFIKTAAKFPMIGAVYGSSWGTATNIDPAKSIYMRSTQEVHKMNGL